jgi:thiol-disulfide isomerase/thioredoxin
MKVIKFGAIWCSDCVLMKPRWQKLEKENPWIKTQYFDYDKNPNIVKKFKIGNKIPVFICLDKNGKELDRKTGELKKEKLLEICQKFKNK